MALSLHDALATGRRGRRRGRRRATLSEINVTPLVDVMLVLLIIFMVSAPLLTAGVPVELPKTDAAAISDQSEPLTLTIQKDGRIFLQDSPVAFEDLAARMQARVAKSETQTGATGRSKPVFVRADGAAPYEIVAQVMARLSTSGFSSISLITDTGGPSRRDQARRPTP